MTDRKSLEYVRARCRVDADGHWIWTLAVNTHGTPVCGGHPARSRRGCEPVTRVAFRASGKRVSGKPLRAGLFVRQTCGEPRCCNPEHLIALTRSELMLDASRRGTISRGPLHGAAVRRAREPRQKVTMAVARVMREQYREIGNAAEIARRFGVSHSYAHRICTGRFFREPSPFPLP